MFDLHSKNTLTPVQSLKLAETLLDDVREQDTNDTAIKLVLCNYVDALLSHMKNTVERPSSTNQNNEDGNQTLREGIAAAYLDHANLIADLGHPKLALNSRRRADKWGGPGIKKVVAPPVKQLSRVLDVAAVPLGIFPDDVSPFTTPWTFPDPDGRVTDTPQLVSCLGLLKQGPDDIDDDAALAPDARKWLKETSRSEDEKTRLETLATDLIRAFTRDEIKDKKATTEVLCLVPVLNEDDTRFLLRQFQNNIEGSRILDIDALRGLALLLQTATPGYLHAQDLIEVLSPMSKRLQETHDQSSDHIFELTVAVSSVLDAMADIKLAGLDREGLHEPLLAFLRDLQGSDDPHLKYYASYAFQALLCVPDNESPWQATVRRTTKIVKGISGLVSAVKGLDLNGFMDGLRNIQAGFEGVQQAIELAKTAYEGVSSVYEGEQDLISSLKEGLMFNRKRAWYSALRGADTLIDGGELAKFRILVCSAPCRRELAFQWGICQRLGSMAANKLWDEKTRQGAVKFLEEIYRNDLSWGQNLPIKAHILDILKQLSMTNHDFPEPTLLLEDLVNDGDAAKQDIYRNRTSNETSPPLIFRSGPPELAHPSLLDRVQQKTDIEADLRRIYRSRVKERGGAVYVPPLAKTYIQATNDELFSLIPMVDEFLSSDLKVLLLLGDSGAGKTTFNRELDLQLWKAYKPRTGRIPLFISLPAIDRPERDLIAKHLRINEFSEPQIREMKDRELVIICDGYDESQQLQNLYESNGFNKDGGWRVQMIVSCRSEHLGQDYRDLFQPTRSSPTDPDLFKQAVLVPFSMDQIKDYIARYVALKRPLWGASDYEGVLDQIPSLQDLVKNPFLLSLSLEVLPRITDPNQKLTTNKITRVLLYDEFVAQWLERNKKRLAAQDLSETEKKALESLSEDGFTRQGLRLLKDLSAAIYNEQGGNPVVEYNRDQDSGTWKERFFDRKDEEMQLLRKAIPMIRNGSRFGFIHRSILEYGVSRAIYEPQQQTGLGLEATDESKMNQSRRRKSTDSTYSFEMDFSEASETAIKTTVTGLSMESPLARRNFIKDPSVMQFLVERVQSEPPFKDQLFGFIEASKTDKKWRIAAANAITILTRAGVNLSRLDLRGIQVPGADMSSGVFDSAQLQGADLRKTNLQSVWFRQAELSRARMEGSRFGEWPTLSDMVMSPAFAYTLDGKMFVAGTADGNIMVYNASTWAILATIQGHDQRVTNISISRDGSLLASGANNADVAGGVMTAKLWNLQTGDFLHVLEGHTERFTGLIFLPSGQRIITGSCDRAIHLWETKSGERLHSFEVQPDHAVVSAIACSNDGELLASAYEDETVRLWNIETSECLRVLTSHEDSCLGITFSPYGKTLFQTTCQGIKTWDAASGKELWTFKERMTTYGPAVYSPDGLQIACGSKDNTILLLDSVTGDIRLTLRGHSGEISNVEFSPDGSQLASGSDDFTVRLWDSKTGECGPVFQGHTRGVRNVHFSASGRQIGSSNWDGTVRLWDSRGSTLNLRPRESHSFPATAYFVPGGHYIVSTCFERIGIWDRESGNLMYWLSTEENSHNDIFVSPCGPQVASARYRGVVKLWNVDTRQCVFTTTPESDDGEDWSMTIATMSLDGTRLLTTSETAARVWNPRTGVLEHELIGHDHPADIAVFSPVGGSQLATFSRDLKARLWDMSTGQCTITFVIPYRITMAAYSSDGSQITAHYQDCQGSSMIQAWDTATGKGLPVIDTGCENPLLFSSDGRLLVTHSGTPWGEDKQDGTLQVWDTINGRRIWTLGKTVGYAAAAVSHDSQFLVSSSEFEEGAIRLWDLKTGQQIGKVDNYRGTHSLALDMIIVAGGGNGGDGEVELTMTAGSYNGHVSVWKLVAGEGSIPKDGIVERTTEVPSIPINQSDSHKIDERTFDKRYEFALQWTTEYGRLNASGARIEGVRGLSRVNVRLLKQHGADGEVIAPLKLHQVATKMMSSKNVLARFKKQPSAPAEITVLAEKDGAFSVGLSDKEGEKATDRDREE